MSKKHIKQNYKSQKKKLKNEYKMQIREHKRSYREGLSEARSSFECDIAEYYLLSGKKPPIDPPRRHLLEEIGNAVTHGVGSIFSVVALILMLASADRPIDVASALIYFVGMLMMFTMSCLYHAFPPGSRVKRIFRRFDYSSIYLLIGATFAPILLCYVGGTFGLVYLIVQWVIIATGITFIAVFGPTRLKILHTSLYLLLGWVGLMFLPLMISNGDLGFLFYILGGGVVYSLGIIPFLLKGNVAHFIWHFFVLGGAVVQWVGVYLTIYLNM